MQPLYTQTAETVDFKLLINENYAAWNTLKTEAAARFYLKDATFFDIIPPVEGFMGWENFRTAVQKNIYDTVLSLQLIANDDLRVKHQGNVAWTTFTYSAPAKFKDGRTVEFNGRQTNVWEKRDRTWLIMHEHLSTPLSG